MSKKHNKLQGIILGSIVVTVVLTGFLFIRHKTETDTILQRKP